MDVSERLRALTRAKLRLVIGGRRQCRKYCVPAGDARVTRGRWPSELAVLVAAPDVEPGGDAVMLLSSPWP